MTDRPNKKPELKTIEIVPSKGKVARLRELSGKFIMTKIASRFTLSAGTVSGVYRSEPPKTVKGTRTTIKVVARAKKAVERSTYERQMALIRQIVEEDRPILDALAK